MLLSVCLSVRLSVCPPVAYTANNSRTQRPSVPKFGIRFPILDAHRFSRSKFKQSKVKVTDKWGIPNPAATLLVSITIMYSKI